MALAHPAWRTCRRRGENACATGSAALYTAMDFIESGRGRVALVVGAEKMSARPTSEVGDILLNASYRKEEADIEGGFAGVFGRIASAYFERMAIRARRWLASRRRTTATAWTTLRADPQGPRL